MRILVIGGGISDEREVSLRSSKAVFDAVKNAPFDVEYYDWKGSEDWIADNAKKFDIALPILHGEGGEDGQIQLILEKSGLSYLGTDSTDSRVCIDKQQTREVLSKHGVLVPEGAVVDFEMYKSHHLYDEPHVLKPFTGGSSIDTFIFPDLVHRDMNKLAAVFGVHGNMLLEQYVSGVEITVPYLEGRALPVIEIIPPASGVFDYANKYNGSTTELCPPEHVDDDTQHKAILLGAKVHEIMGCRDLSRTDIIVSDGKLYVLEINTMPGMTPQSLFPLAAKTAGIGMDELVRVFIQIVEGRL